MDTSSPQGAPRGLADRLGMRPTDVGPRLTVVGMPVAGNTQPEGLLHGGATAALCEHAASLAAQAHARTLAPPRHAVGTEISVSLLRAARGGRVRAEARPVHLGRTSAVYLVDVTDESDRHVASARISLRLLPPA